MAPLTLDETRGTKPPHGGKPAKPCKTSSSDTCGVTVTVDASGPSGPQLQINNDDDWFISVRKNRPATITWTLQGSANYAFDRTRGIEFSDSSISCPDPGANSKTFVCTVTHSKSELWVYKYTIKVVPVSGSTSPAPPVLDPWVVGE
jgi:hypothetical protein